MTRNSLANGPTLTFFMQVHKERAGVLKRWREVRRIYPDAVLIVRFDGDYGDKEQLLSLTEDPLVRIYEEDALFRVEHGGLCCHRMLELFLINPTDFLIKIDPDTSVKRPLSYLPDPKQDYFAGSLQQAGNVTAVQGGCVILSRAACERIYESLLLKSDALKPPGVVWANIPLLRHRAFVQGLSSHDWCLGYVAKQLNIQPESHPDVVSNWLNLAPRHTLHFYTAAIVHPEVDPILGVFDPRNILRALEKKFLPGILDRRVESPFALRTSDFDHWNLPPRVLEWLVSQLQSGSKILELGSGKSSREFSKFFHVTAVEENEDFDRVPSVEYVVASLVDGFYSRATLGRLLVDNSYDAIVVDGPIMKPGRSLTTGRLNFANFVDNIQGNPILVIDDIDRVQEFRLLMRLWGYRKNVHCFFFRKKACAILEDLSTTTPWERFSSIVNGITMVLILMSVKRCYHAVVRIFESCGLRGDAAASANAPSKPPMR